MVGEMEKPLVIGKAVKKRCFENLKINNLPAWTTAATMEEWLNMFNVKMMKENRNVILFLDNASCHPKVTLSNLKIAWFTANATSVLQPTDIDVNYIFKSKYRCFMIQSSISNVEEGLARSVSVLDAVNWIGWIGSEEN
jgi:hypothetical protein